jgi:FtsH-binding integral membrane protein
MRWESGDRVCGVNVPVGIAVAVVALALAAWAGMAAARDRPIDYRVVLALGLLQVLATAFIVIAIVRLAGGARPHEFATFIGYLVAFFFVVPLALALARLEPTRWGSAVVAVAGVVMAVLVLRLDQVWTGVG